MTGRRPYSSSVPASTFAATRIGSQTGLNGGAYATGVGDDTYTITPRDAGDITGGINAADAVLGMDVKEQYARYFDQTVNRGRLQRAERTPSRDGNAEHTLSLPPMAGGEHDSSDTEASLYLANQEIWISQWGGDFYQGRGVPGGSDTPE